MNPRPSGSGTSRWLTVAALVFAVGSVVWSLRSIRTWIQENRAENAEAGWNARGRERDLPEPGPPHPTNALAAFAARRPAAGITTAASLYATTNFWNVHLRFTSEQWAGIEPRQIEPLEQGRGPGGRFELRNPAARRNGLAGVRGLEFDWVHGTVEFEGRTFADAAVRYKGNGTYLRSRDSLKRPFKVDLNKYSAGESLAGRTTLNFANLVADDSCLHDTLGYEVYRAAGVPAPRTAFARLFLSTGPPSPSPSPSYLGLYLMVENLDNAYAAERFGTRDGIFFKPVTTELFRDLGDEWSEYERIYDPKRRPSKAQAERVMAFSRLVTQSDDSTFAARMAEFLDLDEFARFLAVTVLLSSYDGFLNNGQNFYLWLGPDDGRFRFLPWDLDNAWGRFGMVGSASDRVHASIFHPWIGRHRLLERVMAVPEFRASYVKVMGELLDTVFVPEVLNRRIDELVAQVRPVVAEESERKASRFEEAVTETNAVDAAAEGAGFRRNRRPHPLKWFIAERARSVREQLAGTREGVVLDR